MQALVGFAYELAGRVGELVAHLTPPGTGKLRRTFASRRGVLDRFKHFGISQRDTSKPLIWVHAPSVGEGLQALPLIKLIRERDPEMQIAYTHFSPSAERFASTVPADFIDYLPFDTRRSTNRALSALKPTVIVVSKLDVWPTLMQEARRLGIPTVLMSATLSEGSSRTGPFARLLLADAYASLSAVGAIDAEDADRLVALGVPCGRIHVTGDTRYDQVWSRAERLDRNTGHVARLASRRPTLVAGSTWPSDEAYLLPAWLQTVRDNPSARLIIAPHEPTPNHLESIGTWARSVGLIVRKLGDSDARGADVVLVDTVGVLGDLYALADVSYVGGGFHSAGLHSVLEPAAYGAPVLFGPRSLANRDANLLVKSGGAARVESANDIRAMTIRWIHDPVGRKVAGEAARAVVRNGLGATSRTYDLVRPFFDSKIVQKKPLNQMNAK
jgi:3-deoxy-D-manno-octulosonic-acid transferase